MQRLVFRAMGCEMLALVEGHPATVDPMLAEVPGWFATWEQHLSRFRDDSELSLLNRRSGQWVGVSPVLWEVIDAALQAAAMSDGLVAPTLLNALEATGYDRSFELLRQRAVDERLHAPVHPRPAPYVAAWWTLERNAAEQAVRLPAGMRLDLGGITKGWAAETAATLLGQVGPALVDAGGDIAVSGPQPDGSPWTIGIADPLAPAADLACLALLHGAVATSGRDYRRWQHAGRWQHHLIDPRTAQPAEGDILSATVVAPTGRVAEAAAKVAMLLGRRDGLAWLDARPELAGLLVLEDGTMLRSRRLDAYLLS